MRHSTSLNMHDMNIELNIKHEKSHCIMSAYEIAGYLENNTKLLKPDVRKLWLIRRLMCSSLTTLTEASSKVIMQSDLTRSTICIFYKAECLDMEQVSFHRHFKMCEEARLC